MFPFERLIIWKAVSLSASRGTEKSLKCFSECRTELSNIHVQGLEILEPGFDIVYSNKVKQLPVLVLCCLVPGSLLCPGVVQDIGVAGSPFPSSHHI